MVRKKEGFSCVGLDLSLSRPGVTFLEPSEKFVSCNSHKFPKYDKNFVGVFSRIREVLGLVKNIMEGVDPAIVGIETPLPKGQWAAGLFGLGSVCLHWIAQEFPDAAIVTYHPSYLRFIHGHSGYKKSESVKLARLLIEKEGLKGVAHKINHDEAESFLYAYSACVKLGWIPAEGFKKFKNEKGVFL